MSYDKGLSKSFKSACRKHSIQVYFEEGMTIKNHLVASKDKDFITQKSEVIYRYKCDRVECDKVYICEPKEPLKRGSKKSQSPSPIYEHCNITGHTTTGDSVSIVGREHQNLARMIR